MKAITGMKSAI